MFAELFISGGIEIFLYRIADCGPAEILDQIPDYDLTGADYILADLQWAADARGKIAIRIRWAGQERKPHGGVEPRKSS